MDDLIKMLGLLDLAVADDAARVLKNQKDEIDRLKSDVAHWKSNHDNQVARAALLTQRPDLPVDRLPAYREMDRLQKRVAELEAEKVATVAATVERCAKICDKSCVQPAIADRIRAITKEA